MNSKQIAALRQMVPGLLFLMLILGGLVYVILNREAQLDRNRRQEEQSRRQEEQDRIRREAIETGLKSLLESDPDSTIAGEPGSHAQRIRRPYPSAVELTKLVGEPNLVERHNEILAFYWWSHGTQADVAITQNRSYKGYKDLAEADFDAKGLSSISFHSGGYDAYIGRSGLDSHSSTWIIAPR
jgi:hypothetical protein